MTLITTPILTMSTLKILRIVRNSLTYQKSSIGNNICRSKVSERDGIRADSHLHPSEFFLSWTSFFKRQTLSLLSTLLLFNHNRTCTGERHPRSVSGLRREDCTQSPDGRGFAPHFADVSGMS